MSSENKETGDSISSAAITIFRGSRFANRKRLGKGTEAIVYEVDTDFCGKVAVKEFLDPLHSLQEIKTLIKFNNHQNIVRILGLLVPEPEHNLPRSGYVMEHMSNGSLHQVIHGPISYNRQQIYSWLLQASRGLAYLHHHRLLHRDIKPHNMLLGDTLNTLKIADFGQARTRDVDGSLTAVAGTIAYMAPEVFNSNDYFSSADVYSLAVSAWEMFHRKAPFYQQTVDGCAYKLSIEISKGLRLKIETDIEEEMKEVIMNCFNLEPCKRPKIEDIMKLSIKLGQIDTDEQVALPKLCKGSAPLMHQTIWTEEERVILAKTIFGVARGECLEGQQAVGHVVLNRKKGNKSYWGGDTVIGVCLKKNQFACWNGREDVAITDDERKAYKRIYEWVPDLLEGRIRDPTEGCDYFNNPSHQPYPGWVKQAWTDRKKMVDIGNHRFYQIGH